MLKLMLRLTSRISFPKNAFSIYSQFDNEQVFRGRVFYLPPETAYEMVIPGVYITNTAPDGQAYEAMQKTRRVAKLKRAKRKHGKRTVIKNE